MCVSTFLPCQTDFSNFYGQKYGTPAPIAVPTSTPAAKLTTVVCQQTAEILELNQDFGFLNYTVEKQAHANSLYKNGAVRLPVNNGKLFFHASRLLDCGLTELTTGMTVKFNVLHNKKINRYIADCVRIEEDSDLEEVSDVESMEYEIETETSNLFTTKEMLKAEAAKIIRRVSIVMDIDDDEESTIITGDSLFRKLSQHGEAILAGLSQLQMQDRR